MSFIMQALKKADRDRRNAPPPDTSSMMDEMPEEEEEEEEEEESPQPGKGRKIAKVVLLLLVVGGVGYGVWSQKDFLLSFLEESKPVQSNLAPRPPQKEAAKEVPSKPPLSLTAKKLVPDKPAEPALTPIPSTPSPSVSETPPVVEPVAAKPPPPPAATPTPVAPVAPVAAPPPPPPPPPATSPVVAKAAPAPTPVPPAPQPATKPTVTTPPAVAAPAAVATPPSPVAAPPVVTPPAPAVTTVPSEPPPPPVDKPAIAVTHRSTPTLAKKSDQPVGKVVGVHYGCGVEIKEEDGTLHRIHLGGIGCTESDNTFGKHVRRSLAAMIFTKQVRVKKMGSEPDGKPSWEVFDPDNSSVNAAMVRGGLAMALDTRFTEMEEQARRERQGMWADLPAPRR